MDKDELLTRFQLRALSRYHSSPLTPAKLRAAAVLIALEPGVQGPELILTQRPKHLKAHPGQVSFPGGKPEAEDQNLIMTALREAEEEIGLAPDNVEIIGQLPNHPTFTGFEITPVLGWVKSPFEAQIDPAEVQELFRVPLAFLLEEENRHTAMFERRGHFYPVTFIPYRRHFIWGATAAIIDMLCRQLR
ncbi:MULTISPECIES: CoA pyrophosphatase [Shewanella]|uniref:8-oxo-dGTP pyrophosphatase MutT (NUDIX family) n=2 Tax=Shewanella TaxID=22 RepID=A0ABX5PL83_9GAMM|nr:MULTISPECIES: CoA pyrophosphatase [Shewanella]MBO2679427.1 CoA pyrophosphatase [Shewanella algae]MBZ4678305.1 coenzyme pyrophosphatase [Shewanella sp.]MCA0950144.1 CoA pyrophosphatase [Shewanella chilikensis]MCL1152968.1 CoA pyrophosphatase [Shewanella chilikensis]PYE57196.1 8-oxo-dGTP pyrophosphatase MutT (NUDIX family) [Shewanella chilikensis]